MIQETKCYEFLPRMKTCPTCKGDFWGVRQEHLCAKCEMKAHVEWDSREAKKDMMRGLKVTDDERIERLSPAEEFEASRVTQQPSVGGCVSHFSATEPEPRCFCGHAESEHQTGECLGHNDGRGCSCTMNFTRPMHPTTIPDPLEWHGHPRFYEILDDLANLHSQKAQAYEGKSGYYANYRRFDKWAPVIAKHPHLAGFCYSMLRLEEKLERVRNVLEGSLAGDEPITEDLDDMAIISIIGRVLYEESNEKANV